MKYYFICALSLHKNTQNGNKKTTPNNDFEYNESLRINSNLIDK